jgi:hypothetical protein
MMTTMIMEYECKRGMVCRGINGREEEERKAY